MIFLDSSVLLRLLADPSTPAVERMTEAAESLFRRVERGDITVTTSEVVLHEVAYVLSSKAHYRVSASDIATGLGALLRLTSFVFPSGDKRIYLDALALYAEHPRLGFADAVIATRAISAGSPMATFDRHFGDVPDLELADLTRG